MRKCEGGWTWHVEDGTYGDFRLSGLNFSVYVSWPGPIPHGSGEAVIFIDEHADNSQRSAIGALVEGTAGGPWGLLGWTWPKVHGPYPVPYKIELDGVKQTSSAKARSKSRAALYGIQSQEPNPVLASFFPKATFLIYEDRQRSIEGIEFPSRSVYMSAKFNESSERKRQHACNPHR
jgi:hypothetical protein